MPRTRLLLAGVPPLLADIVRDALAAEPEVEVEWGSHCGPDQLAERLARNAADVVLAETEGAALTDRYLDVMYQHPRLKLLLVSPDARLAALYRLAPERRVLAELSPSGLAEAVRAAALPDTLAGGE